jgi:hypothetical protein
MAFEIPGFKPSGIIAASDLTAAQYRFLGPNRQLAAANGPVLGVINSPTPLGAAVETVVSGIAIVICDAAVTKDGDVAVGAAGGAKNAVATNIVVGRALEDGILNQRISVLLKGGDAVKA